MARIGWRNPRADATLLLFHHAVEGARVGPGNYSFTSTRDVIRHADVPRGITAILSGHIHRAQALTTDLSGRRLDAPVLYPGSVERTSFAEKDERKGYLTLAIDRAGRLRGWRFHELPARPMIRLHLAVRDLERHDLDGWLRVRLRALPVDAVVRLDVEGDIPRALRAPSLRALAPLTMNVTLRLRGPSSMSPPFLTKRTSPSAEMSSAGRRML